MRSRLIVVGVLLVLASLAAPAFAGPSPAGPRTCTWGGTPAAPTGTFTITPGITNTPSAGPLAFKATGVLGGDCRGAFTYTGQIDAGSSCLANTFGGRATGLPGVARFAGVGVTVFAPAQLSDRDGNVVGNEDAQVATPDNAPHFTDCSTPQGFTGGTFSSVIVLFGGS